MFRYELTLWIADDVKRRENKLSSNPQFKQAIEVDAVKKYNEISAHAKNIKKIRSCEIDESSGISEIKIELESSCALSTPNRALKVYSSYLASGALKSLVTNKSLFRGTAVLAESGQEELTDEKLMNFLLHSVLRNNAQDKKMLREIKTIIINYGGNIDCII